MSSRPQQSTRPMLAEPLVNSADLAAAQPFKKVNMFQANIKLQSGKIVMMMIPADVTDADVLDLIMEIAKNVSATARKESATSLLTVPSGPSLT